MWPTEKQVNKTCSSQNMLKIKQMQVVMHQHTPSLLRRSVSWRWWTPPVEPCRCPWDQKPDTLFPNNPPASRKGTSWCRRQKSTPGTRHNRGIRPSAVAWEARGCWGHWEGVRLLWKRRRMKTPWGWRACPCPGWGGWRAGRGRSMCPRFRCHAHYHGRTWYNEEERHVLLKITPESQSREFLVINWLLLLQIHFVSID